jgi:phage gp29-like protein
LKDQSIITLDRIRSQRQAAFNPIANLTPSSLASQIAAFKGGYLSGLAYTFEALSERDYSLQTDATKRYKSVSRNPWEVAIIAGHQQNPDAIRHKAALEFFYNNISCTDAMEPHARGGAAMLFRTMARAIGHRYQPHEIVFNPQDPVWDGDTLRAGLSATFTAVPLYFFESRTGPLRFIREPYGLDGVEMPDGEWMVTVGDGLLLASAICWMFKQLALKDWVSYNGKFGLPGIHGKTDAAKDSPEWNAFVEAVENFANDWYAVTNLSGLIELIKTDGGASIPMREMVLKMEEAITKMWRGGDLASQSSGTSGAVGAQGQNSERDMLEADDCEMISETLNAQVDPHVIRWHFGEDVQPLAYFKIAKPKQQNAETEIKVDQALTALGIPQSKQAVAERYGRTIAADGEEAVGTSNGQPGGSHTPTPGKDDTDGRDGARPSTTAANSLLSANKDGKITLSALLEAIEEATTPAEFNAAMQALRAAVSDPAFVAALSERDAALLETAMADKAKEALNAV